MATIGGVCVSVSGGGGSSEELVLIHVVVVLAALVEVLAPQRKVVGLALTRRVQQVVVVVVGVVVGACREPVGLGGRPRAVLGGRRRRQHGGLGGQMEVLAMRVLEVSVDLPLDDTRDAIGRELRALDVTHRVEGEDE